MKQRNRCIILLLLPFYTFSFDQITIKPLNTVLQEYPSVLYKKCFDAFSFNYTPFPLSINPKEHPNVGTFSESYILSIPGAYIVNQYGFAIFDNIFIEELMWKGGWYYLDIEKKINFPTKTPIQGKVAIISQLGYHNYFHWTTEVLARLALLEMYNIEYDKLYVPQHYRFMKETIQLWGIAPEKLLPPQNDTFCIKVDTAIVPSLLTNIDFGPVAYACYPQPHLLQYVRTKLLNAALKRQPSIPLSKKIFISRKDAYCRFILNEDEIFEEFEKEGFVHYELSKLSVIDQIHVFHNADIVVAPQGTTLANIIYCKPQTKVIELFAALNDATFWYISQILDLHYIPIKTTDFIQDWHVAFYKDIHMPIDIIKDVIHTYIIDL